MNENEPIETNNEPAPAVLVKTGEDTWTARDYIGWTIVRHHWVLPFNSTSYRVSKEGRKLGRSLDANGKHTADDVETLADVRGLIAEVEAGLWD
jgi:hypothetical protein